MNLEPGYYDALGAEYRDPKSLMSRKLRLVDARIPAGQNLLDCGCGTGEFINLVKPKYHRIVGMDPSDVAIKLCQERFSDDKAIFTAKGTIASIPPELREIRYDCITFLDVLEHMALKDCMYALMQAWDMLKDEGLLLVTVPGFAEKIRIKMGRSPTHRQSHSSYGWAKICRTVGFKVQSIETVEFPLVDSAFLRSNLHVFGKCCLIIAKRQNEGAKN